MEISIIGASGYTGAELLRLLTHHPKAHVCHVTARSEVGNRLCDIFPNFVGYYDLILEELNMDKILADSDIVFAAVPHGVSIPLAEQCLKKKVKFIDLGADFRLDDIKIYEKWYQVKHTNPSLNQEAVYGLPEINRKKIAKAELVGNPGCFPTSILLGLKPLLEKNVIRVDTILADSKSGTTGAGRAPDKSKLHAEMVDNFRAYGVSKHRHVPEITQELSKIAKKEVSVVFTPHLLPIDRGILSTIYADLMNPMNLEEIRSIYIEAYKDEKFVHLLSENIMPSTKYVRGSNHCQINVFLDEETNKLKIISAIDNVVKGASGQAIQNMNLMFGLPETFGLDFPGMYP